MMKQAALAGVLVQAALFSQALGHGNIIVPKLTGDADHPYYVGGPAGEIDMPELVGSSSYGDYYKAVDTWMTDNNVASLKDFFTTYGSFDECGNTAFGDAQPVPSDGYAQHDTLGNSHVGPCEIWCDSTRVYNNINCQPEFAGQSPAMIPIDTAVCGSASKFVFYWLALHAQPWQAYVNCATLSGSGSGASTSNSTSTATTAPATTTAAPAATTAAPAASSESSDEYDDTGADADTETEAPAATTAAPAATTAAPAADKCNVRRKRN